MKAAYYTALGASDVLTVGEMDIPEPGYGEIRVKIAASGVNPSDWKARQRGRGGVLPFPKIIPQSDGAGVVDARGNGVSSVKEGDRVWVLNGQWQRPFGTAAEYIVLPEKYVIPLPDGTSFEEGACFGIPFLTAHRAVFFDGSVTGQTLLIQGGAGTVGHHAIQIAKRDGARVIATVSGDEKGAIAKGAGADEVLNYRDDDYVDQGLALTEGRGADRIIEVNLSANAPLYDQILAPKGTVVIYGTDDAIAQVPAMNFIVRGAQLKWFIVYELTEAELAEGVDYLNGMLADGALETLISDRFPLEDISAAHDCIADARNLGNVVLNIADL